MPHHKVDSKVAARQASNCITKLQQQVSKRFTKKDQSLKLSLQHEKQNFPAYTQCNIFLFQISFNYNNTV